TYGFEDRFERSIESIRNDWTISGATEIAVSEACDLRVMSDNRGVATVTRGDAFDDFEFAVNIRTAEPGATFGFVLVSFDLQREFRLTKLDSNFALLDNVSGEHLPLPVIYSPFEFRQFRFVRFGEDLFVESEDIVLGKIKLGRTAASAGIHINDG